MPAYSACIFSLVERPVAKRETESTAMAGDESFRKWSDVRGGTMEGRMIGVHEASVILERRDGKKITVPINRFSKPDQQYIEEKSASKSITP